MRSSNIKTILFGGFVAGTVDIGAASLITMLSPIFILKFIAGGLVGKAALTGGSEIALLGLALQWLMSIVIAAVYVLSSAKMPVLKTRWIESGLCYGVTVFLVMNYVVRPLSAWHTIPHFTAYSFCANLAAMLLFGLIIAFFARERSLT